jgi:hypothetical protein
MRIAGLHLVHNAWSVYVCQVPHYRKTYLYFIAHLYVFCPLGLHFIKGLIHKALAHKIRKTTQYTAHNLIHIIIYMEISLFRTGTLKSL